MQTWTLVRFLHIVGIALFVGGQLVLVVAVAPAFRQHAGDEAMRSIARRFGVASIGALAVLIASGAAMASHFSLWSSHVLQVKLMVLVLVGLLTGFHVLVPKSRPVAYTLTASSLLVVWLGVKLTYG